MKYNTQNTEEKKADEERRGRESPGMLAHAYSPSRMVKDCPSFETSFGYGVSSRQAWARVWDSVSKQNKNNT